MECKEIFIRTNLIIRPVTNRIKLEIRDSNQFQICGFDSSTLQILAYESNKKTTPKQAR